MTSLIRFPALVENEIRWLDLPDRAALVQCAFEAHNCRRVTAVDPDMGIGWLLSHQWCDGPGDSSNLHLDDKIRGLERRTTDRE
jgi:hypothetical protein